MTVDVDEHSTGKIFDDNVEMIFTSFGMFIIDEIHYLDGSSLFDVIGGAGTYAVYGARVFLPIPKSKGVGWIVDAGSDFPEAIKKELFSLQTTMIFREDPSRLTTRGWNGYTENETRAFKYTTPKKRITSEDITGTKLLESRTFHLICSPERAVSLITGLNDQRKALGTGLPPAVIMWEPVPDLCKPEHLEACFEVLPFVDVLSPNVAEASAFFGIEEPTEKSKIEEVGERFLNYMQPQAAIVMRAGANGCLVLSKSFGKKWLEAYHTSYPERVVDPTGAGNACVGGLCAGYVLSGGNVLVATCYGNVAAGLAIEQVGLPRLKLSSDKIGEERWNDSSMRERLEEYRRRVGV
ncbi:Ribokinase-like protein [Lipomyces arxii]|uniref:Ribokinase-like protein n=1 Tax=Lipomyces arxii TaxID=56418 RepID=UPI0034CD43FC